MRKILYVDLPFDSSYNGGDKNRSRSLWRILSKKFEADILLIDESPDISAYSDAGAVYNVPCAKSYFWTPLSVFRFSGDTLREIERIVVQNKYDFIFFRFASMANIGCYINQVHPDIRIVFDIDMVFSRISSAAWKINPKIKNRFHFIESIKLKAFERKLFKRPFLFLFSNRKEIEQIKHDYKISSDMDNFRIVHNMIDSAHVCDCDNKRKNVTFFGMLNSTANRDALKYIVDEIFPSIKKDLENLNCKLQVIGKGADDELVQQILSCGIEYLGEVENIDEYIAESQVVLLPLRVASGTLTRILSAAVCRTPVITTNIGLEGMEELQDGLVVCQSTAEVSDAIKHYVSSYEECIDMGSCLFKLVNKNFSIEAVEKNLLKDIGEYLESIERA